MDFLKKQGGLNAHETWNGPSMQRQTKLVNDLEEQKATLIRKRAEMLGKWLEDSVPVKQITEEIDKLDKRISELELSPEQNDMSVIKVTFAKKPDA